MSYVVSLKGVLVNNLSPLRDHPGQHHEINTDHLCHSLHLPNSEARWVFNKVGHSVVIGPQVFRDYGFWKVGEYFLEGLYCICLDHYFNYFVTRVFLCCHGVKIKYKMEYKKYNLYYLICVKFGSREKNNLYIAMSL
jgi:hypothetical protein